MRIKWAKLLSCSFFFFSFFFFFFFCFSSIAKKKDFAIISLTVRVRVCAEDGLKDSFFSFFFAPKLLSLGARLRPR